MNTSRLIPVLVVLFIQGGVWGADENEFPFYVGRLVCLRCHGDGGDVRSCPLEKIPEHDRAYHTLTKPEAEEIALLSGVGEQPWESRICLGCHATAADEGPRWTLDTFDVKDGVQCESCHGAGSHHVDARLRTRNQQAPRRDSRPGKEEHHGTRTMGNVAHLLDPRTRECATTVEGSAGVPPAATRHQQMGRIAHLTASNPGWHDIRRVDRTPCTECHVGRRSHVEVLDLGFRRQPSDRLYKTPVNMAVSPDGQALYVVCEHSNSLIVVNTKTRKVVDEIKVGKRPHDVAVSPDGRMLYVTNRLADSLTVIDISNAWGRDRIHDPADVGRKVVAEVRVGHEPHGVLTDASGRHIYVLNAGDNSISILDAETLKAIKRLSAGCGPWSAALGPDGKMLYVTNVRPNRGRYRDPPRSEVTIIETRRGVVVDRAVVAGGNMLQGIALAPAGVHLSSSERAEHPGKGIVLFTLMRTKTMVPMTRLVQGWVITNGIGVLWPDGQVDQVLLDEPNMSFPDPTDIAVSPDGRYALISGGGSDQVAVVDVTKLLETITSATEEERYRVLPNHLGMSGRFVVKRIPVAHNPRGLVFSPDGRFAYVVNALGDSVTVIDARDYTIAGRIDLGGPAEITEIRHGERLFHSADMTFGRQFSCRSCHPDGHLNGLSFDIEADGIGFNPVDNRTLRGILDTPPFKWEGTNPSLEFQCGPRLAVFFTRLAPFTPDELKALVRYECTIARPPNPHRSPDGLTLAQRRGKAVFERTVNNLGRPMKPEQQCITCHNTPYKTSRQQMPVATTMWFDTPVEVEIRDIYDAEDFGELGAYYFADTGTGHDAFDVPHLINIYNSAPYLHNGSAATLEEIWTRYNMTEGHGLSGDMTRQQLNDLIAYLKAL